MQDYQSLISHLRECHKHDPSENTFSSAADAIEELMSMVPLAANPPDPPRGLREMIRYAYSKVSEMDIPKEHKKQVLSMIMAIDEEAASVNTGENVICAPGIWIAYTDAPIEAACKLATAVRHTKASPVANAVRAALGQDTVEEYINEVFTCDELRELAEHLLTYADHNEELEDML